MDLTFVIFYSPPFFIFQFYRNVTTFVSVEKKCELDRLTAEAAALTKLEAENHEFIEQFILQK
jgi:hypothetical protein